MPLADRPALSSLTTCRRPRQPNEDEREKRMACDQSSLKQKSRPGWVRAGRGVEWAGAIDWMSGGVVRPRAPPSRGLLRE